MMSYPSKEYALIEKLQSVLPRINNTPYDLTIGDDAAVRKNSDGEKLIITADVSVENVHFSLGMMTFEEVGYKSMATNLSDCASMGATPDSAIVQLVFPKNFCSVENAITSIYKGFARVCEEFNFPIIGGDLSGGDNWIIAITLTGVVPQGDRVLTRKGICDNDVLWVTGTPGMSAAGLACLQHFGRDKVPEEFMTLVNAHISPTPRIDEGKFFAKEKSVNAMMDLSDGLSKDVTTLCYDNDLGFIFDDGLTPSKEMITLAKLLDRNWQDWYFHGGEEYELLVACDSGYIPQNCVKLGSFTKSVNGVFVASAGKDNNSNEILTPLGAGSWDHLK